MAVPEEPVVKRDENLLAREEPDGISKILDKAESGRIHGLTWERLPAGTEISIIDPNQAHRAGTLSLEGRGQRGDLEGRDSRAIKLRPLRGLTWELEALIVPGEEDGENPTSGETEVTVGRGHVVPAGGVVGQQVLIKGHGTLQQVTADEAGQRQNRRHLPNEPHAQVSVDEIGGSGGLLMVHLNEMTHEGAGVAGIPGGAVRGLHTGNAITASRAIILKPEKDGIGEKTGTTSAATTVATT